MRQKNLNPTAVTVNNKNLASIMCFLPSLQDIPFQLLHFINKLMTNSEKYKNDLFRRNGVSPFCQY